MKKKGKSKENFGGSKEIAIVNSVTALRFLASFLVIPIFKVLGGVSAAVFSTVFMLTDWVDGFLARKFKASTFFGSIFDGVTDKAFAILTFGLLLSINPLFFIPLLIELGIIVVQNEKMKAGLNVQSNMIGKIKTWVLSASMIGSLAAVDLLNIKPFIEYVKTASLSKVGDIKDLLILMGINIPGIVFQLLTIRSYNKDLQNASEPEQKMADEKSLEELSLLTKEERDRYIAKLDLEDQQLLREYFGDKVELEKTEVILDEIANKKEQLQSEYTYLEKVKILKDALFDPAYYAENKDKQIRVLTKELFNKTEE